MFELSKDRNGNKICRYKPANGISFSVQTLGNMPETHRLHKETPLIGISTTVLNEFRKHILEYGTAKQRELLGLNDMDLFEHYHLLPEPVLKVIENFGEAGVSYENCRKLEEDLKPHGYTFDWYLDAAPYDLKKI